MSPREEAYLEHIREPGTFIGLAGKKEPARRLRWTSSQMDVLSPKYVESETSSDERVLRRKGSNYAENHGKVWLRWGMNSDHWTVFLCDLDKISVWNRGDGNLVRVDLDHMTWLWVCQENLQWIGEKWSMVGRWFRSRWFRLFCFKENNISACLYAGGNVPMRTEKAWT